MGQISRGYEWQAANSPYVTSPCHLGGVKGETNSIICPYPSGYFFFSSHHFSLQLLYAECVLHVPPPCSPHREGVTIVPVGGVQAGFVSFLFLTMLPPQDGFGVSVGYIY